MSTAKAYAYVAESQSESQPQTATAAVTATAIHTARQARRLQHLVNNLPTAVIVLDERGYVAEANPVAISMLGEPLVGQRWLDVIARSFRPRSDDGMEVSLQDGRRVKLAISSLEPEAGQLIVLTDLTETRQLQSRLAHLQRLSTLGKMMASLAHQIRTPLSSALLYAQNLTSPKLSSQSRAQFQHKLVARLVDLEQQVNDMLLFARAGREQQVEPLSLQRLLTDVFAGVEALVEQQQSQIQIQLPEPDIQILGNPRSLAGAIQNLIQNSMQIIEQGAVLKLEARLDTANPQQVMIAVEDNGPGVPEHLRQQIFEPFFTTRSQGTGLGLAVVQAVAHSHNGSIRYSPTTEGGARFELLFPVYVPVTTGQELSYANN
jgi:two-component system sensor histidine kinase FlrB